MTKSSDHRDGEYYSQAARRRKNYSVEQRVECYQYHRQSQQSLDLAGLLIDSGIYRRHYQRTYGKQRERQSRYSSRRSHDGLHVVDQEYELTHAHYAGREGLYEYPRAVEIVLEELNREYSRFTVPVFVYNEDDDADNSGSEHRYDTRQG